MATPDLELKPLGRKQANKLRDFKITSNVFLLNWDDKENKVIYQYSVDIVPGMSPRGKIPKLSKKKGMELMHRLQFIDHPEVFPVKAGFDGEKILWSTQRLTFTPEDSPQQIFEMDWSDTRRENPPDGPVTKVSIKMTLAQSVNYRALRSLINVDNSKPSESQDRALTTINALNVIMRTAPSTNGVQRGRTLYNMPGNKDRVVSPFHLVRGYFQSVRPTVQRLIVNVDVTIGLMVQEGPLARICEEFLRGRPNFNNLSPQHFQQIRNFLREVRVSINIPGHQYYRKSFLAHQLIRRAGRETFEVGTTRTTVAEYFQTRYRVRIPNPDWPGIQLPGGSIFPFDICKVPPGQLYKRTPPPFVQNELVRMSATKPQERLRDVQMARQALGYDTSTSMAGAGLRVANDPSNMLGRLLEPPRLEYGDIKDFKLGKRGVWDVRDRRLAGPATVTCWGVLNCTPQNPATMARYAQDLLKTMRARGKSVPTDAVHQSCIPGQDIEKILTDFSKTCNFIVAFLPDPAPDVYIRVKRFGDVTGGTVTQCIRLSQGKRLNDQYWNNLVLKINGKLGGVNTFVVDPTLIALSGMNVMVLGADVSHPDDVSRPSVSSLVSSWDAKLSRYSGSIRLQQPRVEMIQDMEAMMTEALRNYWFRNEKKLPQVLIFYRDGLSEGEFRRVAGQEVAAIQRSLLAAYGTTKARWPKLTFIVVGKRHHIRFFPGPNPGRDVDPTGNCPSGLVVDTDVTHPLEWDFYLQSQPGLKGTSRPSHYTVVMDQSGVSPEQVQNLSYALCHSYARATRAVSIPAPVYYADLICRRSKFHFRDEVGGSDGGSVVDENGQCNLEYYKAHFDPISPAMKQLMYFL
ncbi:hypothetical protein JAAARDRAFT_167271 [Jaapia argillacea MUCL 33604]|uniref:Piwi domain-containing protein n=1 Tax=Jaapia argillacea MUCL 33604 TaxID=933084 RepID=A0A067QCB5_9AGAM|nr:hypothetical protein JAAARDRAFT_167271 [Jaapia argillacea MUCL 33604]